MSLYDENLDKAKIAALVYLTGPGVPFIYYGEEIGMLGNKPDELLRTPMQWSDGPNGGFTTGMAWEGLNANYRDVNVEYQDMDYDSLLNHYRKLVQLRNQHTQLQTGDYLPFTTNCRLLYPIMRVDEEGAVIVLANIGRMVQESCTLSLDASSLSGEYQVDVLIGEGEFDPIEFGENGSVTSYQLPRDVDPWEYFVLKITN